MTAQIGEVNTLRVVKTVDFGVYLDGGDLGEILLPGKQVPEGCEPDDMLEVFLYHDTENRLIATIQHPLAEVGEIGFLKVLAVNDVGAFLEWGIPKNLFVPFAQQQEPMKQDCSYLVAVYFDEASQRITGSTKLAKFISKDPVSLEIGQQVDLIVVNRTDIGFKTIINNKFWGFLYHSDIFQPISRGQKIQGYVRTIRDDGKVDLVLQKPGYEKIKDVAEQILDVIKAHGGSLPISDKSSAEEIKTLFGISKKTYKKAVGALFKARRITMDENGIGIK
ncbi:MAG: GntR family transcriptional regulator [Candidatus Riflebacteria bacterium]|nr:GntR family transcriptional regulator [Candidatus Riflebacteria bacterium]